MMVCARHFRLLLLAWLPLAACQCVWAQLTQNPPETGSSGNALTQRGWEIKPSIGLDVTHTDNVALQSTNKESDFIIRTSPGIKIQGQSARAKASVDFQLQQVDYVQSEGRDRVQRYLNGIGTVEAIDNWLYVDVSGRISRQPISAFGVPASSVDSINSNVVESTMYQVAPYIKGRLFGNTDYMFRFDNSWYGAKNGPMRDTEVQSLQGNLSGGTAFSALSWRMAANAQQSSYSNNAKNETNSLRGTLVYMFNPQLRFTAIGGRESNDYINFRQQTTNISGWGVDWAPTERTKVSWMQENRYFGQGHNFNFTHRTGQTSWRLSDSRDVTIVAPQSISYARGTAFEMLNEQLRSQRPDLSDNARMLEALTQLILMGISPNAPVLAGFQTSRASINRAKEASFLWNGVRNMIVVSAQSQDRTALGTGIGLPDDFSNFSSTIRQKGINLNWSHKLTSLSTLALMGNKTKVSGNTSNLDTDYTSYSLTFSTKLGAYTSGSLGIRRTESSGLYEYVENAVIGTLLMGF